MRLRLVVPVGVAVRFRDNVGPLSKKTRDTLVEKYKAEKYHQFGEKYKAEKYHQFSERYKAEKYHQFGEKHQTEKYYHLD